MNRIHRKIFTALAWISITIANAKCDLFLKTLDEIFINDEDKKQKILFLQEWFGYMLIPTTKFQIMLWLYGSGANGKSVITHVMRTLLGQCVSAIPLTQLSTRFLNAEIDGKLANIVDEIATNALLHEDELKKIVSGDPILAERKGKDPFEIKPVARIVAATNSLPPSKDSTHGLDRRLMILTFNRTFEMAEMDRDLCQKLEAEMAGVFVWAVKGLKRLMAKNRFTNVPSSVKAAKEYKISRNSVALFKRDCLEVAPEGYGGNQRDYRRSSTEVYEIYKRYCQINNYKAVSNSKFGVKMTELGLDSFKSNGKRYYPCKLVNLQDAGITGHNLGVMSNVAYFADADIDDEMAA